MIKRRKKKEKRFIYVTIGETFFLFPSNSLLLTFLLHVLRFPRNERTTCKKGRMGQVWKHRGKSFIIEKLRDSKDVSGSRSNTDGREFFVSFLVLCNRFESFLGGMLSRVLLVPLCVTKVRMVSFPVYKALFHRHKCFNRNGGALTTVLLDLSKSFTISFPKFCSQIKDSERQTICIPFE